MTYIGTKTALLGTIAILLVCCGCGSAPRDLTEPNDSPDQATVLRAGVPLQGVTEGPGTVDVFLAQGPMDGQPHDFRLVLESSELDRLETQVGARVAGAPEAICWPGWQRKQEARHLEVEGTLKDGAVLVFVKGPAGVSYTVSIAWQ